MNILVTGANGQLGNCIRNAAKDSNHNYIFTDVAELDITDAEAVKKAVKDNDNSILLLTNIFLCECTNSETFATQILFYAGIVLIAFVLWMIPFLL